MRLVKGMKKRQKFMKYRFIEWPLEWKDRLRNEEVITITRVEGAT